MDRRSKRKYRLVSLMNDADDQLGQLVGGAIKYVSSFHDEEYPADIQSFQESRQGSYRWCHSRHIHCFPHYRMYGSSLRPSHLSARERRSIGWYSNRHGRKAVHQERVQKDQVHHDLEVDLAFGTLGCLVILLQRFMGAYLDVL